MRSFRARDGAHLSWLEWAPDSPSRFRVYVLHGMGSNAYEFAVLGEFLAQHAGHTLALQQRANGLDPDPRRIGHAFREQTHREDFLDWLVASAPKNTTRTRVPAFLVGESLGGLLCSLWLSRPEIAQRFAGLILLSPVVQLVNPPPAWLVHLMRTVATIFPRFVIPPAIFIHGKKEQPPLTRDPEYEQHVLTSPYRVPAFTLKYICEVGNVMDRARKAAPHLKVPLLLLNGGKDVFVREKDARAWFAAVGSPDKTHMIYRDSFHLLLHDLDSKAVLDKIGEWIASRLP